MGGARRDFDHFNEVHQHRKLPYYDVLGVTPDATTSEIIRAYRDLVGCFFNQLFFDVCEWYGIDKLTSLWDCSYSGCFGVFGVKIHRSSTLSPGRLSLKLHPAT